MLLLLAPLACVSGGAHQQALAERDQLAGQARDLTEKLRLAEASNQILKDEQAETLEQFEDLRIECEELAEVAAGLRQSEARLSSQLTDVSRELERSQTELDAASTEVSRLSQTYASLVADLESELSAGQIEIEQLREGIRVAVSDEILFASGSAKLDHLGRQVLLKLVDQLLQFDHMIEVQGHTDNRRIRGALSKRFPSNWELAAARAASVVRLMQSRGIPGERLSAVSFASHRPVASNDTPTNRALNRRIEIRLAPRPGAASADTPLAALEELPADEEPNGGE